MAASDQDAWSTPWASSGLLEAITGHGSKSVADAYGEFPVEALYRRRRRDLGAEGRGYHMATSYALRWGYQRVSNRGRPPARAGLLARSKPSRGRKQSARGGYKPRRDPRIRSPPKAALIAFRIAGN